jgi:hypothetical protein
MVTSGGGANECVGWDFINPFIASRGPMGVDGDDDDLIAVVVFMKRLDRLREIVVDETRRIDRSKKTAPVVLALFFPGEDFELEALLLPPLAFKKAADVVV